MPACLPLGPVQLDHCCTEGTLMHHPDEARLFLFPTSCTLMKLPSNSHGIKAHVLDVVQVLSDALPCASTVGVEVLAVALQGDEHRENSHMCLQALWHRLTW